MDRKITSALIFGAGVLVGWAVTADEAERQEKKTIAAVEDVIADVVQSRDDEWTAHIHEFTEEFNTLKAENARLRIAQRPADPSNIDYNEVSYSVDPQVAPLTVDGEEPEAPVDLDDVTHRNPMSAESVVEALGEMADAEPSLMERAKESMAQSRSADWEEPIEEDLARSNLQAMIDKYTMDHDDNVNFITQTDIAGEVDNTPPFVISQALYASDPDEGDIYDKITVTYYERDRVLLDDDQDPIDQKEIPRMVGWNNLSRFGDQSGEMDTVFVRCRRLRTDFEVVRETEEPLPAHVQFGMGKEEFETHKASGLLKFRPGDL